MNTTPNLWSLGVVFPLINSGGDNMAVKNEIGNKYGRLTVLKRVENNYRGDAQWLCQCECGNQVIVKGVSLRSGHTRSCGCLQKDTVRKQGYDNTADLIGRRFGKLIVLERVAGDKEKKGKWVCQCDCGSITMATSDKLLSGHTQSCGCIRSKGEFLISTYLTEHQYNFSKEFSFSDLRRIYPLKFDFAIFDKNNKLQLLIEYDGPQHTDKTNMFYSEEIVENDKAKNYYCHQHNIPLYRISYKDDIENKLELILSNFKASE